MAKKSFTRFTDPASRKKAKVVADVVREVCGFAPFEKRMIELVKTGQAAAAKRAMKFARKRLGSCSRAKSKMSFIEDVVAQQRKAQNWL